MTMRTKKYALAGLLLLLVALSAQAQNMVRRLDKAFDKAVKEVAGGLTSASADTYADGWHKIYLFTVPQSQAKAVSQLDETLRKAASEAERSWMRQAGSKGKPMAVKYGNRLQKTYTFGSNDGMNYNMQCLRGLDDPGMEHVYVLAWGEKGGNITGGIFQFCHSGQATVTEPVNWFYIQFTAGGGFLTAKGDGARVETANKPEKEDGAGLWRWEKRGDAYTFYNKQGYQLYFDNGFVHAGSNPHGTTQFYLQTSRFGMGLHEIATKANPARGERVYLNQWQGSGIGRFIGLWSSPDRSNEVMFVNEKEESPFTPDVTEAPQQSARQLVGTGTNNDMVLKATEERTLRTSADFLEQFNNLATLFATEADFCNKVSKGTTTVAFDSYVRHLNLWTGATNRIMRLCKEHGSLLDPVECAIVTNRLAKMKGKCGNNFENLGDMIEVAQRALKK